jgi:hypothetical protein
MRCENISSRVMVMPREHLIQGNGYARRKMLISSRVMGDVLWA